jgi:hypothetical protein
VQIGFHLILFYLIIISIGFLISAFREKTIVELISQIYENRFPLSGTISPIFTIHFVNQRIHELRVMQTKKAGASMVSKMKQSGWLHPMAFLRKFE